MVSGYIRRLTHAKARKPAARRAAVGWPPTARGACCAVLCGARRALVGPRGRQGAMGDPFVVGWLAELGIDSSTSSGLAVIRKFQEEGIDSDALASLDDAQLKALGVKRMGDRAKLQDKAEAKILEDAQQAEGGAPRARTTARARARSPGPQGRFARNDHPGASENGGYNIIFKVLLVIGFFFMAIEFAERKAVECGCVDTLGGVFSGIGNAAENCGTPWKSMVCEVVCHMHGKQERATFFKKCRDCRSIPSEKRADCLWKNW